MRDRTLQKMNLQLFAEPGGSGGGNGGGSGGGTGDGQLGAGGTAGGGEIQQQTQAPQFDYDKLADLINGKQKVTEDSVLRGYFKQQGLTKEQADQAIASFKQQQAANQPDVGAMQTELAQAQASARDAQIQAAATMAAVGLGVDAAKIPYLLKMADLNQVMGQDGKISDETMKAALNKVLEDIPELKPQAAAPTGFTQIGTGGDSGQQPQRTAPTTQPQVATKRWNRFN